MFWEKTWCKLSLLLLVAGAVGGCGTKIKVNAYPTFYTPDLKCIAVVPFRSAAQDSKAGSAVSESLAAALMENNTYTVFNQSNLRALMDQQDLMVFANSGDASAAASKLRACGKVQGLLVGTVSIYDHTSNTQQRADPQYAYDKNGNQYCTGTRVYSYTRNEATVSVSAALIRVSDGTQIHATSEAAGRDACQGEVPQRDRFECLRRATQGAVYKLLREFAVTLQEVIVSDKNFKTATEFYDGKWAFNDHFASGDPKITVMLQLPEICDRNPFRIVIVRENERTELAAVNVMYDRQWSQYGKGFEFSPAELVKKGGAGTYLAKLYHGPEVVVIQKFEIK